MSAFNIVRLKVKPGCEEKFIDVHRKVDEEFSGMKRAALVKTGERSYCFVGEWDSMDSIVAAREQMIGILDRFRDTLEDQGGDLGVTDPVSGEVVVDIK
ncbi:antibiotic biosynthesis monooxygenase [Marinobacterium sp. D7]|uniref:antibiotic biosynthesis monooxygenase n=1 Tax=Marinobacterium ramblicola TaxID=2849041 RepID=UPI001C2D6461|nr:antibiotic biosynthesis monooxygenase [Marinobacterium ramblicola]MBV1790478.1 antibiotic biosynthesis monooxygenase [Marinobacterium ramblicola]